MPIRQREQDLGAGMPNPAGTGNPVQDLLDELGVDLHPGMSGAIGVAFKSLSPAAEEPTSTILSATRAASKVPASTSAADR